MGASTVTPPAPATSPFLASASWVQRLPAALIRLAAHGFDLNCHFLTIANRQNHQKPRILAVATRKTGVAGRPKPVATRPQCVAGRKIGVATDPEGVASRF